MTVSQESAAYLLRITRDMVVPVNGPTAVEEMMMAVTARAELQAVVDAPDPDGAPEPDGDGEG